MTTELDRHITANGRAMTVREYQEMQERYCLIGGIVIFAVLGFLGYVIWRVV